eukprot:2456958-Prymnesium_polylepis.1
MVDDSGEAELADADVVRIKDLERLGYEDFRVVLLDMPVLIAPALDDEEERLAELVKYDGIRTIAASKLRVDERSQRHLGARRQVNVEDGRALPYAVRKGALAERQGVRQARDVLKQELQELIRGLLIATHCLELAVLVAPAGIVEER